MSLRRPACTSAADGTRDAYPTNFFQNGPVVGQPSRLPGGWAAFRISNSEFRIPNSEFDQCLHGVEAVVAGWRGA